MPWSSVADFQNSETYRRVSAMHAWSMEKLQKFVSSFNAVFNRAKRNGADDKKAESLAFPIAFEVAKRAASAETLQKSESAVHYIAAMSSLQAGRDFNSAEIGGNEWKFTLVEKSLPLLKTLAAGSAVNWDHEGEAQIGVVRDIILRSEAPPEIQARADPAIPFFFVASFRSDIPPESRNEIGVSAEWLPLAGNEALPITFAKSHTPLNGPELGIRQVSAELLLENANPTQSETDSMTTQQAAVLDAEARSKLHADQFARPESRDLPIHDAAHVRAALARLDQVQGALCSKADMLARIHAAAKRFGIEISTLAKAAATSAKGYEASTDSMGQEPPTMPDTPAAPDFGALTTQVASLSSALESEKGARLEAEKKAKEYSLQFAALKEQADRDHAIVEEMKAAALDKEAEDAAMALFREGKVAADKVPSWAARYKKVGREEFMALAEDLPVSHIGVAAAKSVGTPAVAAIDAKVRDKMANDVKAMMHRGA